VNNIKYIFIIIIFFTTVITFAEKDKKYYEDKLVSLAKELEIIDEKSEFPEIYVKKEEYYRTFRKEVIETEVWSGQTFLYRVDFDSISRKVIRITNEYTDRVKNSKKRGETYNTEKYLEIVAEYVRIIRPDINFNSLTLLHKSRPEDNSWDKFFYYFYRKYRGYYVNERLSVGLYPDGTFHSFLINATDNECSVNIQISRKEAEKIALDEIRKKAGLFNRMMLHAGKYSIEVLEKSADGRTGRFFDISKPIIIRPNFAYHTRRELQEEIENGLLKDESEKVIKHLRSGGTEKLRLAWIISLKLNGFRFNEDNNIVVCVDCETGKVLGY